uniref:G domain-containing protein n=1 Tax=Chromera velia CCMP2878 TaxID=1169474 RepID=A0A0G4H7A7_9ALVE|eukprot:Cvel_25018.t1-p1 / transcript=Cvel_25018.t1 / gene=Cvel_25018 / organism=Chromera_velia_CCMP2878 / gene_product=EH domain-containing protein 4, putative / transcript_product=EH domain-containing protein 4, putative / location=Cvel_scaffold2775:9022-20548(-) / protein_length=574 / sequence_SO=supercontig / SO=protein_coding / is_pseudo=false
MAGALDKQRYLIQRIMREIEHLYFPRPDDDLDDEADPPLGLACIAKRFDASIHPVHTRCSALIIGNVSAGKSTFVNWYAGDHLQKTGVAIETNGVTVVTYGSTVNELKGESTVLLLPYLRALTEKYSGFLENLSCKTCPSDRMCMLDLIDSPGLADGDMQYPFDVMGVMGDLAEHVDIVLFLFDPIGQALGRRTLSLVDALFKKHPDKIRFCLSKCDAIPSEEERIKVICQTTQSLTSKISVRHGFDLMPIFVPGAKEGTYLHTHARKVERGDAGEDETRAERDAAFRGGTSTVNRIEDLCDDIRKCVERKVQDGLAALKKNTETLAKVLDGVVMQEKERQRKNAVRRGKILRLWLGVFALSVIFGFLGFASVALSVSSLEKNVGPGTSSGTAGGGGGASSGGSGKVQQQAWLESWRDSVVDLTEQMEEVVPLLAIAAACREKVPFHLHLLGGALLVVLALALLQSYCTRSLECLSRQEFLGLQERRVFVKTCEKQQRRLNKEYLLHCGPAALAGGGAPAEPVPAGPSASEFSHSAASPSPGRSPDPSADGRDRGGVRARRRGKRDEDPGEDFD